MGGSHTVQINQKRVWVDGRPLPLLSGEMHYWRLSPADWPAALRQVRALGLSIVATYVCWDFHQIAPGEYDFTGATDPRRDLLGFVELVAREGLWLILRPGPYIYSEWHNGGIPDEAVPYHRLHTEFQRAAADYMAAVVQAITPHLATRGGPIILVQAENEADPWPQFYEEALGLGAAPGLFQDFLRERYGTISALNAVWESAYPDFDRARAVLAPGGEAPGFRNRHRDFCRFRHWFTAECVRWTAQTYRDLGVEVPIFANVYINNGIQNWPEIEAACDFAGPDYYPAGEFRGGAAEHARFLHILRYTRSYSALPYIPEFESGIWHGGGDYAGDLPPNHYLLAAVSALLAGVAGWNWYMLVERDNWLGSPINAVGRARPDLAAVFGQIVRVFREAAPWEWQKVTDVSVTVDPLQETAGQTAHGRAVLQALYDADVDYECFDVERGQIGTLVLFYAGEGAPDPAGQRRLQDYVQAGGCLVIFQEDHPHLPGVVPPDGVLSAAYPQQLEVALGDERRAASQPAFWWWEDPPGEAIFAERVPDALTAADELRNHCALPVGRRYAVGYRQALGAGSVVVLGVRPDAALVDAILRWLGIRRYSRATVPQIKTALFRRGAAFYLTAVNLGDEPQEARIALALPGVGAWEARDLVSGQAAHYSPARRSLTVALPRKSGTVVRLAAASD